ncbi:MAG: flippase-like domain-containing protein [Desulfurococcales archaeon]|nr:flippase-like domain-containing protein [Desulfurococcales archaeon]
MVFEGLIASLNSLTLLLSSMNTHALLLFLIAVLLYIASTFAWAFRWWYLLRKAGTKACFKTVYESVLGGILVNNLTPSLKAGGEGFRVFWLRLREGVPMARGIATTLYERLSEVPPVAVLVVIGLHYLGVPIIPGFFDVKGTTREWWKTLKDDSKKVLKRPGVFVVATTISSLIWLQDVIRLYLIAHAVGLDISMGLAATLSVSYLVLGMMPTPAGVGFVEGGFIGILIKFGYSLESTIAMVTLERLVSTVLPSVIGALLVAVNAKNMGLSLREVLRESRVSSTGASGQ